LNLSIKVRLLVTIIAIKDTNAIPATKPWFYKIGRTLGKGAFGRVNLGIHKLSGKFVAVKTIKKEVMTNEDSRKKVLREVSIWEQLTHPSVIRLYETFESEKYFLCIEELCSGGDLLTYVRKRRRLNESVAKYILKQLLEGLYYCYSKNILHRDVKLDNILLNTEGKIKVRQSLK
jgi:NUAK family SNF1-like kinase